MLEQRSIAPPWQVVPLSELSTTPTPVCAAIGMHCFWRWLPTVIGATVYAPPDLSVMHENDRALYEMFLATSGPTRALYDMSAMRSADFTAALLGRALHAITHAPTEMVHRLERIAYVVDVDWVGPFWQGINTIAGWVETQSRVFRDRDEAMRWLELPADATAAIGDLTVALCGAGLFERTERWLDDHPHADLRAAAIALGASGRSLQRALAARGTSFVELRARRRVALATRLLMEQPAMKVDAIAVEVGFGSLSQFYETFRRIAGVSPTGFRRGARSESNGAPGKRMEP